MTFRGTLSEVAVGLNNVWEEVVTACERTEVFADERDPDPWCCLTEDEET